ncbi:flagellar basal body-associated FliL family protein [Kozakia baliensis]|uniref:flagellar basal body-associated FliL family protein n=1 Tax=Kozakia baliensis TaxID=153496 RepID=UPI001D054B63|nr:flagellar basal body-associated FliL family protein [Kozakia baliensis]
MALTILRDAAGTIEKGGITLSETAVISKTKRGMGKPLWAVLAGIVLLGGGGIAWWRLHNIAHPATETAKLAVPYVMALPSLMSTLDSGTDTGRSYFVRVTAQLQLSDEKDAFAVKAKFPEIQDLFQTYFHNTRPDELAGVGIYRLREAMLAQINNIVAPIQVQNLFFTELLVQ